MLPIDIPTIGEFKTLAGVRHTASVSIYLPTSPLASRARVNRIAFKDLAKAALRQLGQGGGDKHTLKLVERQFDHLSVAHEKNLRDEDHIRKLQKRGPDEAEKFWRNQALGLAVLATPNMLHSFRLPYSLKPLVEVADRLHLLPLIRAMSAPQDLFVLKLSEESVGLIHVIANMPPAEIQVAGMPKSAREATHRPSIHVRAPRNKLQNLEGEKVLLQAFARKVDQAVYPVLAGRATPLVLAAADPIASIFRGVNSYPHLLEEGVLQDAAHLSDRQVAELALPMLGRLYQRRVNDVIARFDELKPRLATTDISYAAHAATAGAIDTLLVDLDAVIPGLVSDLDGSVTYATSDDAETYSVVDEIARRALCSDARVLGAKGDDLPNQASLVAILRYQFGIITA